MTLREQIDALPGYQGEWVLREAVLDLVRWHHCIPDRDALVRALVRLVDDPQMPSYWTYYLADMAAWEDAANWQGPFADAIIAALETQE